MSKNDAGKKDNGKNLIGIDSPYSLAAEQYRILRTNIHFSLSDRDINSIVITSAAQSEGKSTIAANLAVAYARDGKRILLVDADMRKPTVHVAFSLENSKGLSDVLALQAPLKAAIQPTYIDNLDLLASGPIPENPTELLNAKPMDALLEHAKSLYDVILFDAPPVLSVADSQVLANKCDGTLLVINSGTTEREDAVMAKEAIHLANSRIIGAVLNNFKNLSRNRYVNYSNLKQQS